MRARVQDAECRMQGRGFGGLPSSVSRAVSGTVRGGVRVVIVVVVVVVLCHNTGQIAVRVSHGVGVWACGLWAVSRVVK